ncbi:transposase-like zinc-binding domain-containing protein [Moraxella bovis]|uniref:IS1/IS1595 family N-terminal zinc-binding domain-containing protein n=1 Tax=Moraxella bovis TaxID=476 RepID=UPI000DC78CC9|nr:hypothetical protein DQF64_08955 [Moraxella bovis]
MSQIFTHCPKCQSPSFVKAGFNNGKQRYKCKDCCYYFSAHKHASHKSNDIKKMGIDMYLEGLGFRSIGRVLNISMVQSINGLSN